MDEGTSDLVFSEEEVEDCMLDLELLQDERGISPNTDSSGRITDRLDILHHGDPHYWSDGSTPDHEPSSQEAPEYEPILHDESLDDDDEDTLILQEDLVYSDDDDESQGGVSESGDEDDARVTLIRRLAEFYLSFLEQMADCVEGKSEEITLQLVDRRNAKDRANSGARLKKLTFPRKTHSGTAMRRIAQLLGVVRFILEALQTNVPVTKRDIYYRDVALFQKQANVDTLVDDLAATLGVTRHDLNVRASSKGLFCGSALSIRLRDNTMITGHDNQPVIIPSGEDIEGFIVDEDIRWVLLVEKEAIFQTLCRVSFAGCNEQGGPGIIITGKGYPDVATRQLVHKLSIGLPERIPVFALVDADPYGIDIMACYSFGSESLDHERESLVSERVICIGVLLSELRPRLGFVHDNLQRLTDRDVKKINLMLARRDNVMPEAWKNELRHMLAHNSKAEIEIVCDCGALTGGTLPLVRYLESRMQEYFLGEIPGVA